MHFVAANHRLVESQTGFGAAHYSERDSATGIVRMKSVVQSGGRKGMIRDVYVSITTTNTSERV